MNVYKTCPEITGESFTLRLVRREDCADLLKVYSDPKAVPLFNSDNCNGDDFYYKTSERMMQGIEMWIWSYDNGWFVRWSIVDRQNGAVVGTIEMCRQEGDGTGRGILRIDLRSDYEREDVVGTLLNMIVPPAYGWFGCASILTKAVPVAGERIAALTGYGFVPSNVPMIAHDGTEYGDYYAIRKAV